MTPTQTHRPYQPPPLPWDVELALREAYRLRLYAQLSRIGNRLRVLLYRYNRLFGTYFPADRRLVLPDPDLPPFEAVGATQAVKTVANIAAACDPRWEPARGQIDALPPQLLAERRAAPVQDRVNRRTA